MRERVDAAVVFCASLLVLGWGAGKPGLATAYVDPVARIPAQDEAVYGSTAFGMAASGDWITPRFLGRYVLYKPPLEYWLAAGSVKILGRTALALRTPSILAGAATITLVYCWLREAMPLAAALAGALLLLSSHMFFVLSRLGLTDALLTFEMTAAMYVLMRDPRLESRGSAAWFGLASGAALMTKALAGLFPLLALAVFCVASRQRPRWVALARLAAVTAAVAVPWHLWQFHLHPRWFWAEYVLTEQIAWGLGSPLQTSPESQLGFYLTRLAALDPVLFLATLIALMRARSRVPVAWLAVVLACVLAFEYRNASYLGPAYPAMAVLAAGLIPFRWARAALVAVIGLLILKALAPAAPWGLPFAPESVNPSHAALEAYAALHRGNDLIVIQPDDQFYSADLDLAHVRYCYLDPSPERRKYPLDFEYLGITVTAPEFEKLTELRPVFARRLREWNMDSSEPMATVILAKSADEIAGLIHSHPDADFYVPPEWASGDGGVHQTWQASGPRAFFLSRVMIQRP